MPEDKPALTKAELAALAAIPTISDPKKLRTLIENAKRQKSAAVEEAAFLRLCEVQPSAKAGSVEFDVWRSIHALEEMLRQERGKTIRLSRTRQMIDRVGELQTVSHLSLKPDPSEGFHMLISRNHPEMTFEAVVLRHELQFPTEVIGAAKARLAADSPRDISDFGRVIS